jgi:hypothetical protein
MDPALPPSVFREAFYACGEKRLLISRLFYSVLLGSDWRYALMGFAYIKCLDDVVDEDPEADRGQAVMAAQKPLLERIYAALPVEGDLRTAERYGCYFFRYDARNGSRLRPLVESILETMEFDTQRRGRTLSTRDLDDYIVKMGRAFVDYVAYFVSRSLRLPRSFVDQASRAYLYADSLIDLEHDLPLGVINIPSEDLERYGIDLEKPDGSRRRWLIERSADVDKWFGEALEASRRVNSRTIQLLSWLFLGRKRREFRRFLKRGGIPYAETAV